jgi:cyclin-dependent kinase 8/11
VPAVAATRMAAIHGGGGGGGGGGRKAHAPRIAEKYAPIGKIGEGTYGLVYKARQHVVGGADGGLVAVKKFKSFKSMDGISPTAIREIKLLRELKNRYIVDLVDVMMDEVDKALYLVFDYAEHDLLEMIRWHHSRNNVSPMPMQTVKSLTYQILQGINHLHTNWIIHRDLKPSNILVTGIDKPPNERGCVKIADFGLARLFQSPLRPMGDVDAVVVTIWYRAPELLLGAKHYTKAIDLWAIGCIFAELITSKPLFQGVEKERKGDDRNPFQADQVDKIFRVLGKPTPKSWPGVTELPNWTEAQNWQEYSGMLQKKIPELPADSAGFDLLSRLLEYNPAARITASEALQHPFFAEEPRPQRVAFVDPLKDPYKCRPVTPLDPKKDMGWAMSNNGAPPAGGGAGASGSGGGGGGGGARAQAQQAALTSAPPPSKRTKTAPR